MTRRDGAELLLLGALWGASFLFMRLGAVDFGPLALVFVRVAGAALVLMPLLLARGEGPALRQHWRAIAVVGLVNSALPFLFFTLAALALSAALMSVFNATAPIWGALVARLWLGDKLGPSRALGLAIGVAGVVGLSWGKADFRPGLHGVSPALGIAACVAAAMLYGVAANLSRRHLGGVPPMAVAAGSQLSAALLLALPAAWAWPAVTPGATAWWSAGALAVACTGAAYVLYFRLIAHAGAANAISVTFLIPAFAMLWGWLFLAERPTAGMLAGCAVILLGTALSTGLLRWPSHSAFRS
ncbi:MAG: DMT family transporter [Rubrivivax sp.]|nr:DMT family transporter [Rubrivivax sp.]